MRSFLRPRNWIPALAVLAGIAGSAAPASAQIVSINNVSQTETNGGTTTFSFTLSASRIAAHPARTVVVTTADVSAVAADGPAQNDYEPLNGVVVNIPAANGVGVQNIPVDVTVNGDNIFEPNETFQVNLSNLSGGVLLDGQGIGTIENDDVQPTLSVADDVTDLAEGTGANTTRTFTVSLSNPSFQQITVDYATLVGTANSAGANPDYNFTSGTLVFPIGSGASQDINVTVLGDAFFEGDEDFFLQLNNVSPTATIADSLARTQILNDDTAPQLSVANVTECEEDGSITFTLNLSAPSAIPASVTVSSGILGDTATEGDDYTSIDGAVVTFQPGVTSQQVVVTLDDDSDLELNEVFTLTFSGEAGLQVPGAAVTGTILDNDGVNTILLENLTTDGTVINGAGGPVQRFRATATNGCGDPVPGAPLTFTVDGNTGSDQQVVIVTDAFGQAVFEYTPLFPGTDTITVSDETIGAIALDVDTNVNISVASNVVNGQAAGSGYVDVIDNLPGFFSLDVNTNRAGKAKGSVQATVPGFLSNLKSTKILGIVIGEPVSGGRSAVIFGVGKAKGVPGKFTFRVDVLDIAEPGTPGDRFVLTVQDGGQSETVGGALRYQRGKGLTNDIRVRAPGF